MSRTNPNHPPASAVFVPDHRLVPGSVPAIVDAALYRLRAQILAAADSDGTDPLARAGRADRLAELHTRRARWWRVLSRHTDSAVAFVYLDAVLAAGQNEHEQARFWAETAADWRARAERRPTSDAAGALSNWAELGVA